MKNIWKWIKRVLFIVLLLFVILAIAALVFTSFYGNEIKQYVLNYLNQQLETPIQVGHIEISFIKDFPDISVVFNDVVILSSKTYRKKDFKINTDTLLKAKEVSMNFNIIEILKKQYELKGIGLNDASVLFCIDKKGQNNFKIFKSSNDTIEAINVKLKNVHFKNVSCSIVSLTNQLETTLFTEKLKLSGNFYENNYNVQSKGNINIKALKIDKINYLKNSTADLKLEINVNNNTYKINKGVLKAGKVKLLIDGIYEINEKNDNINLTIEGKNTPLEDLKSVVPENYQEYIRSVDANGLATFNVSIQGGISQNVFPRIKAKFSITEGELKNNHVKLDRLSFEGSFDNGVGQKTETSTLRIDTLYALLNDSVISGSFSIYNFKSPLVKLKAKAAIDLNDIKNLFQLDTLETLKGLLQINLDYTGLIKDLSKINANDYQKANVKGRIKIKDGSLQIQNSSLLFDKVNGDFYISNNDIITNNATLYINNSPVVINGLLKNIIAYWLMDNYSLDINANVNIDKLDLNAFEGKENTGTSFGIPENISFTGNVAIGELKYNKFLARQVNGFIEINKGNIYFNDVAFKTLEGTVKSTGKLLVLPHKQTRLQAQLTLEKINIKTLFSSFDNFGQTFILDKHLSGILSASINYLQIDWDSLFNVIEKNILLDASFEINNGQLKEFEPLYALSNYIELDELRNIRFSKLKNDISISNGKIIIPNMEVKTSAFNIEVSGEHTFDNEIEYRIKLLLREWLANKAKKNKKENMEFGIEENDGLGSTALYLIIKGTTSKYSITYDSKKMKEQVKESLKQEKQELKSILKEEFGLFKKDSSLIKQKQQNEELNKTKFKIEWEEDYPQNN